MKTSNSEKIASIAIMAILILSMTGVLSTQTHGAVVSIPTFLEIQVSPNPVGIGQPIYMQVFLSKPMANSGMNNAGDRYTGITVNITAPNGDVTHLGPYTADPTGGIPSLEFTPTQLGNYTFQANYPGQTLMSGGATYVGDKELPSVSQAVVITVQQAPIPTIQSPPLPTAYWDFPIEATNYGWSVLGGNWLGLAPETFAVTGDYDATGNFNPYTTAPTTAHIMWYKPTTLGGQIGGPIPGDEMHNFMTTTIISDFFEPIIMQGMLIYGDYNTLSNNQAYWEAIDLATGQTVWKEAPGIGAPPGTLASPQNPNLSIGGQTGAESLRMGEVVSMHSMQEFGSVGVLYSQIGGGMFGGIATWRLYSAFNGMYLGNITSVGSASYIQDNNPADSCVGTILGYFASQGNLTMWNSTLCWANQSLNQEMIRPPTSVAWSRGDQWNVTVPTTFNGNPISPALSVSRVTHDVILMRSAPSYVTYDSVGYAVEAGFNALNGQMLWMHNVTIPAENYLQVLTAGQDVYVLEDKDTCQEWGYSMTNGSMLWGPTQLPYNALSTLSQAADIAYGNVYTFDLGGYCTAINLATGKIAWVYQSPSAGYNTPYGVYPIWQFGSASIGGGELFFSLSRMYDPPLFENATRLALNATTGKPVWDILSFSGRGEGAVGDGYLVEWNSYDAQIYTFGKGPSEITAAVQNSGTTQGNEILVTGMVTDISPGTQQAVQKGDFPQGVPCVADSSMSDWMEHVYMQQPMPTNVTGVPVVLSVLDSNGNYRQIGTATTDASGFYSFTWTPDISGKYTVYASFPGTQSYWPANTETAFTVAPAGSTPAPTASPVGNLVNTSELTMYIVAAIIVMIVALAIATVLILRKRP